jgi:hypothetical protein
MSRVVREVLDQAASDGVGSREAAGRIARERLGRLTVEYGVEGSLLLGV